MMELLTIGFVALLFAPLWLGELISALGSHRHELGRIRRQAATQRWSKPEFHKATGGSTSYRAASSAETLPTHRVSERKEQEPSPSTPPTGPTRAWSWEAATSEEINSRYRTQRWQRKQALDAVINEWRRKHGFPTFGLADPAKAPLLERYILMLSFAEQVIIILAYGLLDGSRQSHEQIAVTLMTDAEDVSCVEQHALWKIDALHKHAEARDMLGLMWVREKKAWIHHLYTEEDRRALRRDGDRRHGALATVEDRARRWLEIHTEPARRRAIINADRPCVPACGLIDAWQVVRGLKRRKYGRHGILKASAVEKCLALLDFPESPVARSAWLIQLTHYIPDRGQKQINATGAIGAVGTKHRQWATVEAIENASETEWLLSNVSAHQRLVLELAFGINTPGCFSDPEIAQLMDVSLEEVTEMKLYALERLRSLAERQRYRINS